jgi:ubiquinone/menaquinone biosynthesis C-methylase UbiE
MHEPPQRSDLEPVRGAFEQFGRDDALYAALSRGGREGRRWDPDEFFANGRQRIAEVMAYATSLGSELRRGRALDFGTGPGRLAQALADHFEHVTGVDIAASMVDTARAYNQHGERVEYVVNTAPDLHIFDSESFDFVYTEKVLQHIPPELQAGYIAEFVRVLRPGGLAIFQTRNGPRIETGTLRSFFYTLNRRHIRRLLQRLRGRPPYEMHFIARPVVEEIVAGSGGRVVDVVDLSRGKPNRSLRYCVVKGAK